MFIVLKDASKGTEVDVFVDKIVAIHERGATQSMLTFVNGAYLDVAHSRRVVREMVREAIMKGGE